jgi:enolase 1/2/3
MIGTTDSLVRHPRLERGIRERAANAVLGKINQIGTLTEPFEVIARARAAGFRAVVSARSGERGSEAVARTAPRQRDTPTRRRQTVNLDS